MTELHNTIVIDHGMSRIRVSDSKCMYRMTINIFLPIFLVIHQAGLFCTNNVPQLILPTTTAGQMRCGNETVRNPLSRDNVDNWDDMEIIYNHMFENELRIDTRNYHMLMSEKPQRNKQFRKNRETLIEMMFETYNIRGMHLSVAGNLSLLSIGKSTGCVLDCGEGTTSIVPIYHGFLIYSGIRTFTFGGMDCTNHMLNIMTKQQGYNKVQSSPDSIIIDRDIVSQIKERYGYVSLEYEDDLTYNRQMEYQLPDGTIIHLGNERFRGAEVLFQPAAILRKHHFIGIPTLINNVIRESEIDTRRDLYRNIYLTGGSIRFPGFVERIRSEIAPLLPPSVQLEMSTISHGDNSVWIGGSIYAQMDMFKKICITQNEYDEYGSVVMNNRNMTHQYGDFFQKIDTNIPEII